MANEIWNNSGQGNFIANNSIFILDIFAVKSTSEVLGRLHNMIYSLPQTEIYTQSGRLTSPYDVSKIQSLMSILHQTAVTATFCTACHACLDWQNHVVRLFVQPCYQMPKVAAACWPSKAPQDFV